MRFDFGNKDTICAPMTVPGRSSIAVVRVSGDRSLAIVREFCDFIPLKPESHTLSFGKFKISDPDSESVLTKVVLDEVLVSFFMAGKSFTGEETIEISFHGNPVIVDQGIQALLSKGCRMAEPGEFSFRAFMNGKLDLSQVEAIHSAIFAKSAAAVQRSVAQLSGVLKNRMREIEDHVVWVLSRLEANLDFANEDIEIESPTVILARLDKVIHEIKNLLKGYRSGQMVNQGIRVVLVGSPNVGKSSILNSLLGFSRALVSEIPGTTRDTVEGELFFNGHRFAFVDTAGIRLTEDEVESAGIERSLDEIKKSDFVVMVEACGERPVAPDPEMIGQMELKKVIRVVNKLDLLSDQEKVHQSGANQDFLFLSTKTGEGVSELLQRLCDSVKEDFENLDNSGINESRHFECFSLALDHLQSARLHLANEVSPEFVLSDIQFALEKLFEISGKRFDDEVLDRVFKDFCLGK
jgi:tRNA modification GTPase